jgi:hypothetical protein
MEFLVYCPILFVTAMAAAAVCTAAMVTASVVSCAVLMVTAIGVGVVAEIACNKSFNRLIAISAYTAQKLDARTGKCHLGTTSDASANQHVCTKRQENGCERAMSLTVGANNGAVCDFSVRYGVYLKLLGMSEVLKNLSVFVSNCNFHVVISP